MLTMSEVLQNTNKKQSSFDWKKLQIFLFSQNGLNFQTRLHEEIRKYPDFLNHNKKALSLDEQKRVSAKRIFIFFELKRKFFNDIYLSEKSLKLWVYFLYSIAPSTGVQFGITSDVFPNAIKSFGTDEHMQIWQMGVEGKIIGGFCLTEIGHGSNTKLIQTTATYDNNTKEFILNTPNFEAAKCWAGNVGIIATHCVVYAQLIMPNGTNHGLHIFLVHLRDTKTFHTHPGITIGDMGEKVGLNGIDNGFVLFDNYRIPKTCLLNKLADIDHEGKYIRHISSQRLQFGVSMGVLSKGRISIIGICNSYLCRALTIALRFATFKTYKNGNNEVKILEHQYFQRSLLSYLSVAYITDIIINHLFAVQNEFMQNRTNHKSADMGIELHAISSAAKALTAWTVRNGIQKCKEVCEEHGNIKASVLSNLIANHDANSTYEGECHVLIQQAGNWLLKLWPTISNGEKIYFPLGSVNFLSNALEILTTKFSIQSLNEFMAPHNILLHFEWLICFLLKESYDKYERIKSKQISSFWAKNESQVYFRKTLAIAYIQAFIIRQVNITILECSDEMRNMLTKMLSLYGIWCLEKHLAYFYKGGYADSSKLVQFTNESILFLCKELERDAMDLVNVIAPPDIDERMCTSNCKL